MNYEWPATTPLSSAEFKCGYCQHDISSNSGYQANFILRGGKAPRYIYICHQCENPTFFDQNSYQTPGPSHGNSVEYVPVEINTLYNQARDCMKVGAYTASVLLCRKILMHIAVEKGAEGGLSFIKYVNYLSKKKYVPPGGGVDLIREKGNEANHEIVIIGEEDAKDLIDFLEMLLIFTYEFSGKLASKTPKK